ncbi:uncharacterized protein FFB20_08935 [Fusarium fujikuroi]|nr:uncharacterized protein FFE2_01190 [Fusarium fujikuroi]SCN71263.1 uncharacterized protein FFC1_01186 [Fusarium fujikuroi]SCN75091.1 uncharacterized protein FFM5_01145 [Fusarium fujikuroi]SCN91280.1 uncharacterized protein FFB20_08935 [Fusarium fujikuroi]SCO28566.1 uncharacterized protein FFMR_01040 [Fusarium fujikuroi]
MLKCGGSPYPF